MASTGLTDYRFEKLGPDARPYYQPNARVDMVQDLAIDLIRQLKAKLRFFDCGRKRSGSSSHHKPRISNSATVQGSRALVGLRPGRRMAAMDPRNPATLDRLICAPPRLRILAQQPGFAQPASFVSGPCRHRRDSRAGDGRNRAGQVGRDSNPRRHGGALERVVGAALGKCGTAVELGILRGISRLDLERSSGARLRPVGLGVDI